MNAHETKQLQSQINKAAALENSMLESLEVSKLQYEKQKLYRIGLERRLEDSKNEPKVSEHALLRYCERVLGFDIELAEKAILTEVNKKAIKTIVSGSLPLGNGFKAVIKNMTVVSIVEN